MITNFSTGTTAPWLATPALTEPLAATSSPASSFNTLGAFSLVSSIGGGLMSAFGNYNSAAINKINLQGQANIARINAGISEQAAEDALDQGNKRIAQLTLKAGQLKGSQRATLAANGVDLGEGSAAELQASTDIMKDIDTKEIQIDAVRSAWGYRTQGANYRGQAAVNDAGAKASSPLLSGATSLLSSAGSVAKSWYQLNQAGAFN